MTRADLLALADRVERLRDTDRTIDARVAVAVGHVVMRRPADGGTAFFWAPIVRNDTAFLSGKFADEEDAYLALGSCLSIRRYTTSLNTVTALIAERLSDYGWGCGVRCDEGPSAIVSAPGRDVDCHYSHAATPALALLAAALRTLAAKGGHDATGTAG